MKKTIILIHGVRGTHHGLGFIASYLSAKYKVITPDLPGSGMRAELDDKTIDGYVEWIHGYIGNLKLKQKPYVVGHSMGSMVVSHYLEKYPDDTQHKTILMSPIFRSKFNQTLSNIICALLMIFLHLLPKSLRYRLLRSKFISYCISHFLTYDKTQQKSIDQLHYRYSGRFSSADSIMADIKISMRKQTIIPTDKDVLLIIGDKDQLTSLKLAHKKAKKHHIAMKIIPNSGHLINYETPKQVADAIDAFIS